MPVYRTESEINEICEEDLRKRLRAIRSQMTVQTNRESYYLAALRREAIPRIRGWHIPAFG